MGLLENFAQVIRGQDAPVVTGWDGYRAFELLTAVQLSLMNHTRVTLPLNDVSAAGQAVQDWLRKSGWPGD
jgi:hypothetical protein